MIVLYNNGILPTHTVHTTIVVLSCYSVVGIIVSKAEY